MFGDLDAIMAATEQRLADAEGVGPTIAAALRDVDAPASLIRGLPILARTAGLLAHLAEEDQTPMGFHLAAVAEEAIEHAAPFPPEATS